MKTVHLVHQTHWDREWYFTKEDSNILLYNEIFKILEVYKNNPNFTYVLDAQAVLIEEFINMYPDTSVLDLIREKKLFIGPWYTQTDTLLVSKEAIISNLYYGIKAANLFGTSMNIGYMPDAFGQSNYLPSIFKNFGLEKAMFQRGLYSDEHSKFLNFSWGSPDGTFIDTHNMLHGYAVFGNHELSEEFINKRALPALAELEQFSEGESHLMIPCGWDQTSIDSNFIDFVKYLNQNIEGYHFLASSYEDFMNQVSFKHKLETTNNLRATERSRLHRTIGSSRYDIKLLADQSSDLLINQLQPLVVIYHHFSNQSLQPQIDRIWKILFDCNAHDSIGACNSNQTNNSIVEDLSRCKRNVESLINLIQKRIALSIEPRAGKQNLVLFNLDIKKVFKYRAVVYGSTPNLKLADGEGREIDYRLCKVEPIKAGTKLEMSGGVQREIEEDDYYKLTIDIDYQLNALGYQTLYTEFVNGSLAIASRAVNIIENDYIRIEIINGQLVIFDKAQNQKIELSLIDDIDNGDTYDFDPVLGSEVLNSHFEQVSARTNGYLQTLEVKTNINLAACRNEGKDYQVKLCFELDQSPGFKLKMKVDNINSNHRVRLQVKFADNVKLYSGNGFSEQLNENDYDHLKGWVEKGYAEKPVNIFNFEKYFVVKRADFEYRSYIQGCKEVSYDRDRVCLTLFRGVGVLGKPNLSNRPGRASGINNKVVLTPDSQLLKKLEFNLEFIIGGQIEDSEMFKKNCSYHLQSLDYFENRLDRFNLSGFSPNISDQLSLVKLSGTYQTSMIRDDKKYIYIRLYNPANHNIDLTSDDTCYTQVNLLDKVIDSKSFVPAKGYLTIRIRKGRNENEGV